MSTVLIAEKLSRIMPCEDGTCCCIPKRGTVIFISVIHLLGCVLDLASNDTSLHASCEMRKVIDSMRKLLVTFFQMANIVLLLASIFENALLVDVYVWYSLGYIVLGFMVAISEFATRTKREGVRSLITFLPDVVFLFVNGLLPYQGSTVVHAYPGNAYSLGLEDTKVIRFTFWCLPLVDLYRKHLYSAASISSK